MFAAAKAAAAKAAEAAKKEAKKAATELAEEAKKEAKQALKDVKDEAQQAVQNSVNSAKDAAKKAVQDKIDAGKAMVEEKIEATKDAVKNAVVVNINTGTPKNNTRKKNSNGNANTTRNTKSVNAKPNAAATKPNTPANSTKPNAAATKPNTPAANTAPAPAANTAAAPAANTAPATAPPVATSSAELTIPFDNFDRYNNVWKMCKMELAKFKPIAQQNKGSDLTVVEDTEAPGKFSLKSPTADLLKTLSPLEVLKQLNLFRYRDLMETTKDKIFPNVVDFFHEVEANREYHARACIALCCLEEPDVKADDVKDLKVSNLDVLDRKVYEANKSGKPFSAYELTFLVNPLMVSLAQWEVDSDFLGSTLYEDKYLTAIMSDENLPAHLRLLSRVLDGHKENAMKKYPESVLMNYAYFYPLVLYPTGNEPGNEVRQNKSANKSANKPTPIEAVEEPASEEPATEETSTE
jgi:chemotaxis protein histidine kinase CheA